MLIISLDSFQEIDETLVVVHMIWKDYTFISELTRIQVAGLEKLASKRWWWYSKTTPILCICVINIFFNKEFFSKNFGFHGVN